jgi:uncharacterized protein (DUF1499 family)
MSPGRFFAFLILALVAVGSLGAGGAVLYGRERLWEHLFGPPDMGPYDFDAPTRTGKPNDALACPPGACPDARPEREPQLIDAPAETVYAAVRARVAAMPGTVFVYENAARGLFRAVVRTPWLRLGDTLSVRVREETPGRTGLWVYSRSQVGHEDLGTNDARVRALVLDTVRAFAPAGAAKPDARSAPDPAAAPPDPRSPAGPS